MSATVHGGKTVAGASVGMLMLESRFPRIAGDGGNALTWPFPMLYKVVAQATPERVVLLDADGLVDAFVLAGRELVAMGADGITTSCGFLVLHQAYLCAALEVPVASSALLQVPWVQSLLPAGRRVGVLTISGEALGPAHLRAAGAADDTPVQGVDPGGVFATCLLGDRLWLDIDAAREEVIAAGRALVAGNPEVGALVLECTNMCPYAADVARATGRPVYDFVHFVTWFHGGLRPRRFKG